MSQLSAAEHSRFRDEVRDFLKANPRSLTYKGLHGFHPDRANHVARGKRLDKRGWTAPAWPIEYGGQGRSAAQFQIFDKECDLAGTPELSWNGTRLVDPATSSFGSDALKRGIRINNLASGFIESDVSGPIIADERVPSWIMKNALIQHRDRPDDFDGALLLLAGGASALSLARRCAWMAAGPRTEARRG